MPTVGPVVDQLPTAPNRGMSSAQYPVIADAWAAKIGPWTTQVNALTVWMGQVVDSGFSARDAAIAAANAAALSATAANDSKVAAAQQVGLAAAQVTLATTQATNAANSAAAAEAAGGLGSIAILHAISLSL
jgi:hypothetical protein